MESGPSEEITRLLKAWGAGQQEAMDQLAPLIYAELRHMAHRYVDRENANHTLQTTALVNEAYLRLVDAREAGWNDRVHFFAVAAQMMRRILVDAARARKSDKRGGGFLRLSLNDSIDGMEDRSSELIALHEALDSLAKLDPRKAKVIEMRFFGGLSVEETAAVFQISPQSVLRDWKLARAWLMREMAR